MLNSATIKTLRVTTLAFVLATVALAASQPAWADEKKATVKKPEKTQQYLVVTMSDAMISSY